MAAPEKRLRCVLDRFEADPAGHELAVLVFADEQQLVVARAVLPASARPGDTLLLSWAVDEPETRKHAQRVKALQDELFG